MLRESIPRRKPFAAPPSVGSKAAEVARVVDESTTPKHVQNHSYGKSTAEAFIVGQTVEYQGRHYLITKVSGVDWTSRRFDLQRVNGGLSHTEVDAVFCALSTLPLGTVVKYLEGANRYKVVDGTEAMKPICAGYRIAVVGSSYNHYKAKRKNLLVVHT